MRKGKKGVMEYLINQLDFNGKYDVFYDADKGEWVIKPTE